MPYEYANARFVRHRKSSDIPQTARRDLRYCVGLSGVRLRYGAGVRVSRFGGHGSGVTVRWHHSPLPPKFTPAPCADRPGIDKIASVTAAANIGLHGEICSKIGGSYASRTV